MRFRRCRRDTTRLYRRCGPRADFPETLLGTSMTGAKYRDAALDADDAGRWLIPAGLSGGDRSGCRISLHDGLGSGDCGIERRDSLPIASTVSSADAAGKPATDMQPYLGMAGHAAFVKTDRHGIAASRIRNIGCDSRCDAGERKSGDVTIPEDIRHGGSSAAGWRHAG